MNPPVPIVATARELQQPDVQRVRGGSMTCSSVTPCSRQPVRIDLHLEPCIRSPQIGDVRHAGHAHQPGPDRPVGDHRHVDQRVIGLRRQADLHDAAGRRQRLDHDRRAPPRSASVGVTAAIRSCTSCRASSRSVPGLKISTIDDRSRDRLRAHRRRARDAVQRLLQRDGDQLLDLGGRQPEARRLNLDPRRRELGERRRPACRGSCRRRRPSCAAANATTRKRNFRLDPTIQRIMAASAPSLS